MVQIFILSACNMKVEAAFYCMLSTMLCNESLHLCFLLCMRKILHRNHCIPLSSLSEIGAAGLKMNSSKWSKFALIWGLLKSNSASTEILNDRAKAFLT